MGEKPYKLEGDWGRDGKTLILHSSPQFSRKCIGPFFGRKPGTQSGEYCSLHLHKPNYYQFSLILLSVLFYGFVYITALDEGFLVRFAAGIVQYIRIDAWI